VRVRGEDDAPIAHASVVVMQGTQRFGALADSAGRLSFHAVPPGRGELIVRAAGRRSVHRTLRFEDAGCESLDVGLRREKGGPIAR
jgi:hypothetical protein